MMVESSVEGFSDTGSTPVYSIFFRSRRQIACGFFVNIREKCIFCLEIVLNFLYNVSQCDKTGKMDLYIPGKKTCSFAMNCRTKRQDGG